MGQEAYARLVARFHPGCRLIRAWRLTGGASAESIALEIEAPGGRSFRRVVRRHGEGDRAVNPAVALDEYRLLQVLRAEGFAVPAAYEHDDSGRILSTPYIVTGFVEGTAEVALASRPFCTERAAAELAHLHRLKARDPRLAFLARRDPLSTRELAEERAADADWDVEQVIRQALERRWPLPAEGEAVLLHGDFWPGNLLWQGERLAAVIDWEDACLGDPLVDLGPARLELLWAWGEAAVESFTAHYRALTGRPLAALALYDLWCALRALLRLPGWGLPAAEQAEKRLLLRGFVDAALTAL
jgi:aminoglycoside phosphotransferase (APT) family kinase protein